MNFGKKTSIESYAIEQELADSLYGEDRKDPHHKLLSDICKILEGGMKEIEQEYICLVEQKAIDAFLKFSNEVYDSTRNEATGIIAGYYLHHPEEPNKKIIVATNFLQATGSASSVTCEFSYDDSIRHSSYCDSHRMLPVVWVHSHPGFGVFYSSTDSSTLRNYFSCNHQVGIVVDNIQNKYLGFKIYNEKQCVENIYVFNLEQCISSHKFIYTQLNEASNENSFKKKSPVSFKHLTDTSTNNKNSAIVSFQMLQKLSSQLTAIEKDNTVDTLKQCVDDLSTFIKELKQISIKKVEPTNSNYTVEDMRRELSIQINEVVGNINNIFESLKADFSTFSSLGIEIDGLKDEVKGLRCDISNKTDKQDDVTNRLRKPLIDNWFKRFFMSYKVSFNLRELIWICILIVLTIIILKLKFFNQ